MLSLCINAQSLMSRVIAWLRETRDPRARALGSYPIGSDRTCISVHGEPLLYVCSDGSFMPLIIWPASADLPSERDQDLLCEALACVACVDKPMTSGIHALPFRLEHLEEVTSYLKPHQRRVVDVLARVLGVTFPRSQCVYIGTHWPAFPGARFFLRLLVYYRALYISRVLDRTMGLSHAGPLVVRRLGVRIVAAPKSDRDEDADAT